MVMKVTKINSGRDSSKGIKEKLLKERKEEKEGENDGHVETQGKNYFLVHAQSFFCRLPPSIHRTLGADNRWPYH